MAACSEVRQMRQSLAFLGDRPRMDEQGADFILKGTSCSDLQREFMMKEV